MGTALLTVGQSRWALQILLGLLSATAIASSAPSSAGGVSMLSGIPGDIRGPAVMLGSIGLGGILVLRIAYMLLPKPWRIYVDRLEFTFVAMLWICWTSGTMSFSAFTIHAGLCAASSPPEEAHRLFLPTCPLLTFDLALLHLLSTASLALMLVILSKTLSPGYYFSHSTSLDGSDPDTSAAPKVDPETTDAFVMWDLAIGSPPASPRLAPTNSIPGAFRSYGTHAPTKPIDPKPYTSAQPANPYADASAPLAGDFPAPMGKRDKFAEGRVWSYVPLALCSVGASICVGLVGVVDTGGSNSSGVMLGVVGAMGCVFSIGFLILHVRRKGAKAADDDSFFLRHCRALEVSVAGVLFLLWPLAAIVYTLFPPTPTRPCDSPASSVAPPTPTMPDADASLLAWLASPCFLASTAIALAWLASWLILARVLGLIFPMPEVGAKLAVVDRGQQAHGEEGRRLLGNEEVRRPQVGWGRMVAGEAFELGADEEE